MIETLKGPKQTKARKAHVCNFCGCTIPVGEIYNLSTHVFNGELYDWKSHQKCSELVSMLNMEGDEGVTLADFYEYITNAFARIWNEMDPEMAESKDFVTPEFSKQSDFVYNHLKQKEVGHVH